MTTHSKNELRPFIPLLVGQGKLAKHLVHYFTLKKIPFLHWAKSRNLTDSAFVVLLKQASHAWILVSDRGIADIASQIREREPALPLLHSSAATQVPGTHTLHPLQTFGPDVYDLETYETVPFVIVQEEWIKLDALKGQIEKLFRNPVHTITQENRTLYHAYCVMMANFPQMLWSAVGKESEQSLQQNVSLFAPILKQATANFITLGNRALTGPLVRGDLETIQKHQNVLAGSKLLPLYQNFVKLKETV